MQLNIANFHRDLLDKAKASKHLLMGYFFLLLVFAGAISSVYYWEYKAIATRSAEQSAMPHEVGSGAQAPMDDDGVCAQVITRARNTATGEIRDFPTPCDVKGYWQPLP